MQQLKKYGVNIDRKGKNMKKVT